MNHTTEPQANDGARHVPVERLQHYIPEVEQRVQGWFASGQPLVWIPILSQENFPDVPQQLLEFADHYVIRPSIRFIVGGGDYLTNRLGETGKPVDEGFKYSSDNNPWFLTLDELRQLDSQV